jgi:REP-associated tyrosine transposase
MSYVKIWIHAVWRTKNDNKILTDYIRKQLFLHIKENAKEKGIYVDFINGHYDHVHCLLTLNADLSISKTMQLIKGESSFWANKNNLLNTKIEWADEYFAVSASESMIDKVREYIKNQYEHHKNVTFQEEYDEFMKKYKFLSQG